MRQSSGNATYSRQFYSGKNMTTKLRDQLLMTIERICVKLSRNVHNMFFDTTTTATACSTIVHSLLGYLPVSIISGFHHCRPRGLVTPWNSILRKRAALSHNQKLIQTSSTFASEFSISGPTPAHSCLLSSQPLNINSHVPRK